jgi:hypothetical protein
MWTESQRRTWEYLARDTRQHPLLGAPPRVAMYASHAVLTPAYRPTALPGVVNAIILVTGIYVIAYGCLTELATHISTLGWAGAFLRWPTAWMLPVGAALLVIAVWSSTAIFRRRVVWPRDGESAELRNGVFPWIRRCAIPTEGVFPVLDWNEDAGQARICLRARDVQGEIVLASSLIRRELLPAYEALRELCGSPGTDRSRSLRGARESNSS